MILDSLIIANILVPPLCIIKLCLTKKGLKFDHVFIISAGFLYYWLFPIVNYQYNLFGYWNEVFPKISFLFMFFPPLVLSNLYFKNNKYLLFLFIVFFCNREIFIQWYE